MSLHVLVRARGYFIQGISICVLEFFVRKASVIQCEFKYVRPVQQGRRWKEKSGGENENVVV